MMGVFKSVWRGYFKPCVNVTGWSSWAMLRDNTKSLLGALKPAFSAPRRDKNLDESFEVAVGRQQLTKADLVRKVDLFRNWSRVYFTIALICFLYTIYLMINLAWVATLVTVLLCILFLAKTYQARLWMFQIEHRKLGCTFSEWWHGRIEEQKS